MASYPNATHYSQHFSRKELDCRCGCKTPASIQAALAVLAGHLELLRAALGGHPYRIHSGYRCAKHNAAVGGAPHSLHMRGMAADGSSDDHPPKVVSGYALKVPAFQNGGIGLYPTFTHTDYRGYAARW